MSGSVVLIGLSGSGKSTVGREVAAELQLRFEDTARNIEQSSGRSIADIFRTDGEAHFRALEQQALRAACQSQAVIATGGGAVLSEDNRRTMRHSNLVVWLDPPLDLLVARLSRHQFDEVRPLLEGDLHMRLANLHLARSPLYAAAADIRLGGAALSEHELEPTVRVIVTAYRRWLKEELFP